MPTSARPGFFPHSRQGTRALPYKALRYRARADRGVRPYGGGKRCGEGGTHRARPTSLILYGETGGVEPRPYGSQGVRWDGPM